MKEKRKEKACTWFTAVTLLFSESQIHFSQIKFVLILPLFKNIRLYCSLIVSAQMLRLSVLNVFLYKEKNVGRKTFARNYILHLCMTQAKLKTMNKKTHKLFIMFCCLPYHVLPASVGAMYLYICFYFVLANNKRMVEQRYILQTISDEH